MATETLNGIKHDKDKIPLGLLPPEALIEIAKVFGFGAKKYSPHNWRGGFKWSRLYDALLRHLYAWQMNEDLDEETKLSHLGHAGCCLTMLLTHVINNLGEDDRYKKP